jgi:hypothetical protein
MMPRVIPARTDLTAALVAIAVLQGVLLGDSFLPAAADETKAADFSPEAIDFFEKHIRPALVDHCYECHAATAKTLQGGLRLDSREAILAGGDSGAAVVPGKPDESLLIESVLYGEDSFQMPPAGKLPDAIIKNLQQWIRMGAPAPADEVVATAKEGVDDEAAARHWAFVPPVKPAGPPVQDSDWPRDEIDRFVLARLEKAGLTPSDEADRRTLIRRLHFDLVGLPPSYEEVAGFLDDSSEDAAEQLVDQLLASPHFGERWARHWLDVARYADTKGYVFREERSYGSAYTYRDWVIQALNEDMPYDRFLVEQIAADRLIAAGEQATAAAMGFLTLGRRFLNRQPDIIDDRIDVLCRGTMALTVGCARCHDHKYDPVPMADYYSLYGVFASSTEPRNHVIPVGLQDAYQPVTPRIFIRGNPRNPGDPVPRRFLRVVAGEDRQPFQHGSGRLEMARAIASPENPLTARVMVNRVWGHLFGRGLVDTPSDFGRRSDPPSHPQLLDYLAVTFVEDGWSVKRLIRRIVLSRVYRQASLGRPQCREVDPDNRLLWRMNRRRADFETMRDSLLVAAGQLDRTIGGRSVKLNERPFPTRRTLYGFVDRQNLPGEMRAFDFANPDAHAAKRHETTVPQQALFLMNSPFVMQQAEHLAKRAEAKDAEDPAAAVHRLYRFALARDPDDEELSEACRFVQTELPADKQQDAAVALTWQYGYGHYDEGPTPAGRVAFQRLPHFTGTAWQGGPKLPDPRIGWVTLNAAGGHPGDDQQHAAIRRWTSPVDGTATIQGELNHPGDQGDGVRARVISSRLGVAGEWIAKQEKKPTRAEKMEVRRGDTIDLMVDCRTSPSFDGFTWTVELRSESAGTGEVIRWQSSAGFRGPAPNQLSPWARLAQVLLMSNEFMFVD